MTHLPNGAPIVAIPEALRQRDHWVLWRLDPKKEKPGELTKVPYRDIDRKALANKPQTWLSFDEALRRWAANPNGWAGIGYEFSADDPYTGIDFDNCIDQAGRVADWADYELALLLPTYAEISPSGKGIKLWIETDRMHKLGSDDKAAGQIEVYSAGRFFAVTGQPFEDAPPTISRVDDAIIEQIIAREQERRRARRGAAAPARTNGAHHNGAYDLTTGNGAYPRLPLPDLVSTLDRLHADRWSAYDDWLKIGMALHHWGGSDAQRDATAKALFDQYSKERAPEAYGQVDEKWISFGKNGHAPITVGTLISWASEDAQSDGPPDDGAPHPADAAGASDDEPEQLQLAPVSSFPELPKAASIDEAIGKDACPWLDEYVAFSRRWSPRSYEGFHEACGLWVLSTIAARRVMLPLGGEKYTNLYIALCARTSLWAKSTAAKIAIETIRAAGLSTLLAPDDATPQAFIKRLAEQLPPDWGDLPEIAQRTEQDRLAFAGQRGWFFEEFGEKLSAMMRDGNVMADYRGHFRRFDDCPASYSYSTIGRGMNTVERPYLALLANLTPADLAPFARKGSSLWGDGFFARYAFVTPPAGSERSRERFPVGWRTIPSALSGALKHWHEALGAPDVDVEPHLDDKGKITGHTLHIEPIAPQRCTLGAGVVDAFYRYHDALTDLVDAGDNTDLDGSYTRFADKALRVAMLLASFSNNGRIELSHWARAQAITERWRASLHSLIDQLGQSEDSPERTQEMKVLRVLERRGPLPARDVARFVNISTGEAQRILDQLVKAGELVVEPGKRTKRYRPARAAASVVSVVVSQPSYPAQNYDSSEEAPRPIEEVSYKKEDYDTNDYTTVTTLPGEEAPVPDGDWGSDDDRARLARECAELGQYDTAEQIAEEIENNAYRAAVQREIAALRPPPVQAHQHTLLRP